MYEFIFSSKWPANDLLPVKIDPKKSFLTNGLFLAYELYY